MKQKDIDYLNKLFLNHFDCYSDSADITPAMTQEKFIEIAKMIVFKYDKDKI